MRTAGEKAGEAANSARTAGEKAGEAFNSAAQAAAVVTSYDTAIGTAFSTIPGMPATNNLEFILRKILEANGMI